MATTIENGDMLQGQFFCRIGNQYSQNTVHFLASAKTGAGRTDTQMAEFISNVMGPLYRAALATTGRYMGMKLQIITPTRRDGVQSLVGAGDGEIAGDQLPTQTCGLVQFRTGLAVRWGRGRIYLPATSEGENTNVARPGAIYLTAISGIAGALRDGFTETVGADAITLSLVIYSRSENVVTPVTSVRTRQEWATQRRRSQLQGNDPAPF